MLSLADAGHLLRILMALPLYCIYCMFNFPTYRYIIQYRKVPLPRTHPNPTDGNACDAPRSFYCSAAPVWAAVWRAQAQGALNWDTMLRCSHYDATVPYYQYYDKYYATTMLRCGAEKRGTARAVVTGHGAL